MLRMLLSCLLLIALAGCANKEAVEPGQPAVQGTVNAEGLLAYEHSVSIELPADALSARMAALRSACTQGVHGRCSLLEYTENAGEYASGRMQMRLVPEAVEPMLAGAADGGQSTRRSTRAEDLSVAVADNARERDRLSLQQQRLDALAARTDLSVAEHLQLARELSALEAERLSAERIAAQQSLRLETNLLTLEFQAGTPSAQRWSALGEALSESLDNFVDGLIEAIEVIAYALPYVLLAFPLALLWWALWRLATRGLRRDRG
jgi:hypothetical protein